MFKWFTSRFMAPEVTAEAQDPRERIGQSLFSTHAIDEGGLYGTNPGLSDKLAALKAQRPQLPESTAPQVGADGSVSVMDTEDWQGNSTAKGYDQGQPNLSNALVEWYANQGFIGWQLAALVAQHWLIAKVCAMPGKDAIRNGFVITTVDGDKLDPEIGKMLKRADKRYSLANNLKQFVYFGRVFGIRICIFKVDYGGGKADDDAYARPFNIDGVRKGAYQGMVQIDPYWCSPMLDQDASAKPDSMHFYEPTWWQINGRKYHRSHLVIFRNGDVADILKPAYLYGGIPIPQLIMERVYGAERTANEAPLLALTKRTMVYKTDVAEAVSKFAKFQEKMQWLSRVWNNFGSRIIGENDEIQQIDTSLSDMDALIMTQYQLVAAGGGVPSTKLLGTAPKGFNATGEFDESSYHEELESLQFDLTPFVERHHMLCIASMMPEAKDTRTTISWEPLDSPTAKEYAEINKLKAETGKFLVESGALDGQDERTRVASDKNSDYVEIEVVKPADAQVILPGNTPGAPSSGNAG